MADWDQDNRGRAGARDGGLDGAQGWRDGRGWRDKDDRGLLDRRFGGDPGRPEPRAFGGEGSPADLPPRTDRPAGSGRGEGRGRPGAPGANRSYGEGGDAAFGQMATGSSDSGLGGYGGADVGGWGQPHLNSQWGQGGYAPLNQGDYGQDGGSFRAAGYDPGAYGPSPQRAGPAHDAPHDPHHVSYHHWRNTQLSSHDRDYARWREEQARRYDEDYGSWRNERHSAFSKEFEGWRASRGGQAGVLASTRATPAGSVSSSTVVNPLEASVYGQSGASLAGNAEGAHAHGANPTLARIADGEDGHRHSHDRPEGDIAQKR